MSVAPKIAVLNGAPRATKSAPASIAPTTPAPDAASKSTARKGGAEVKYEVPGWGDMVLAETAAAAAASLVTADHTDKSWIRTPAEPAAAPAPAPAPAAAAPAPTGGAAPKPASPPKGGAAPKPASTPQGGAAGGAAAQAPAIAARAAAAGAAKPETKAASTPKGGAASWATVVAPTSKGGAAAPAPKAAAAAAPAPAAAAPAPKAAAAAAAPASKPASKAAAPAAAAAAAPAPAPLEAASDILSVVTMMTALGVAKAEIEATIASMMRAAAVPKAAAAEAEAAPAVATPAPAAVATPAAAPAAAKLKPSATTRPATGGAAAGGEGAAAAAPAATKPKSSATTRPATGGAAAGGAGAAAAAPAHRSLPPPIAALLKNFVTQTEDEQKARVAEFCAIVNDHESMEAYLTYLRSLPRGEAGKLMAEWMCVGKELNKLNSSWEGACVGLYFVEAVVAALVARIRALTEGALELEDEKLTEYVKLALNKMLKALVAVTKMHIAPLRDPTRPGNVDTATGDWLLAMKEGLNSTRRLSANKGKHAWYTTTE